MAHRDGAIGNERLLSALCTGVLAVIFSLGLWPFHVPANDVVWLGNRNGLRLGHFSTVIGAASLDAADEGTAKGDSLEIWLQPARVWTGGTFLSFSQDHSTGLQIQQALTDLALESASPGEKRELHVDEVFRQKRPRFITVTSGASGTAVYVDGVPAKTERQFRLSPKDFTGRLILGDAPGQTHSWAGMLLGAAIYREELTPAEVLTHYHSWTAGGRPEVTTAEHCAALYLLNERSGRVVHNQAGPGGELQIPARYVVVDQKFLEPVREEFSMSRSYWSAVLKNIVGFLPVGFVFYAYFGGIRGLRRAGLVTVLLGALISLTIEVVQGFLPTRDSGTSDLITNTLGTWLGVLLYRRLHRTLAGMFPWLPIFPEPHS
jgi:hypothetical protein